MVEMIPGARGPVLIDGASHFLQEDQPDEVAAAIREFIDADSLSYGGGGVELNVTTRR